MSAGARLLSAGAIALSAAVLGCAGQTADTADTASGMPVAMMPDSAKLQRPAGIAVRERTAPTTLDVSELIVILHPVDTGNTAADLLVTDPAGRRTGLDPKVFTGIAEIPHASYDSAPPLTQTDEDPPPASLARRFDLVTPPAGRYVIDVLGRRRGPYALEVQLVSPTGLRRQQTTRGAVARSGDVHRYAITYSPADNSALTVSRIH